MNFEVTILGCGSATPTLMHSPTAQIVSHYSNSYLIDCGEGTQLKLRHNSFNFQSIGHIFISHLHGDHYLGLQGLLSTMQLLGRTKILHIYAHHDLEEVTRLQLRVSKSYLKYEVIWHKLQYQSLELLADLDKMQVYSFPLYHRIPTCGFLFREKPRLRNIKPECIAEYKIPVVRIKQIKSGADYILEDGTVIPNASLTNEPHPARSYAYCSDTAFSAKTIEHVRGVDLLYHESTFLQAHAERAQQTHHSTAAEAAQVAKEAEVGGLLLGHFSARYRHLSPFLEESRSIFLSSHLAREGVSFPIGPVYK